MPIENDLLNPMQSQDSLVDPMDVDNNSTALQEIPIPNASTPHNDSALGTKMNTTNIKRKKNKKK